MQSLTRLWNAAKGGQQPPTERAHLLGNLPVDETNTEKYQACKSLIIILQQHTNTLSFSDQREQQRAFDKVVNQVKGIISLDPEMSRIIQTQDEMQIRSAIRGYFLLGDANPSNWPKYEHQSDFGIVTKVFNALKQKGEFQVYQPPALRG